MPELYSQPDVEFALNDRDLLRRFIQDADENAFAEIVRRHQGLVLGVCRRVMGDGTDVDDAFQATFLTLARRPRQVRKAASLSSWLYTVAWRTSWRMVKQRRKYAVESLPQQPVTESSDPLDRIASAQDCLVLDEELNALPQRYREVLVMTYFASQTSQQIADQLCVSKGTVDGRIRQARNMLRVRLARRGVAIGALAVAAGLASSQAAAAPAALLESTIQLGAQSLSGISSGAAELPHLDPFITAETAMISSKAVLTTLLCTGAVAGILGMNSLAQEGPGTGRANGLPSTVTTEAGDGPFDPLTTVVASVATPAADDPFSDGGGGESDDPFADGESMADETAAEPAAETVDELIQVYAIRFLKADELALTLRAIAPEVALQADARSNSVIVRASQKQLDIVSALIERLDTGEGPTAGGGMMGGMGPGTGPGSGSGPSAEPAYSRHPSSARPAEKWMYSLLDQACPTKLDFTGEMPLRDCLTYLAAHYSEAYPDESGTKRRLSIVADTRALEDHGLASLEDVLVNDIELEQVTLENALELLFSKTDEDLTYEIRNEVLMITTTDAANERLETRVYNVAKLLMLDYSSQQGGYMGGGGFGGGGMGMGGGMEGMMGGGEGSSPGPGVNGPGPGMSGGGGLGGGGGMGGGGGLFSVPTQFGGGGFGGGGMGGGMAPSYPGAQSLRELVMDMTSPPCTWQERNGDGGAIQTVGNTLVVRQTQAGHREIVKLLNLLTKSALQ